MPSQGATESADKDEQIRQRIVGAWLLNDSQGSLTLVFRTDGTFVGHTDVEERPQAAIRG